MLEAQERAEPAGAHRVSDAGFVDWGLAERVALRARRQRRRRRPRSTSGALDAACADAVDLVLDYTGLRPAGELPAARAGRSGRVGAHRAADAARARGPSSSAGSRTASSLPGPLGGLARSLAGAAAGAEAGVAVGYGARKVLGQYDVAAGADGSRSRAWCSWARTSPRHMLQLGEDPELFLRWIAIHETTHSIQFGSVPWLRPHLAELLDRLIEGASARLDHGSIGQRSRRRLLPRRPARRGPHGAARRAAARCWPAPSRRATLDRLQAAMSVIEGHAEHVMDAAAAALDPGYARLRERLEARRASRGGLGEVIARLLGLELKLRQYRSARRSATPWSPRRAPRG